ncbi:hypothetical protein CQ13_35080 [Bradyrhizobium retamae]|uniref:Uncharacterized protein n=1 Tax=Bradyrhizobium retamae TaxID=1300035 RepID=A0A0R3MD95_9BRAD|nr:hypothetical protein CQ13_35080 [Bradyrhizobium retamae]
MWDHVHLAADKFHFGRDLLLFFWATFHEVQCSFTRERIPAQDKPSPSSVYHLDTRDNTRALWRQRNAFRNAKFRHTHAHQTY